ncbi:DUF5672 family protein [Burkholderia sp. BCC0405]|uniref:DUF5672 family protein n=1 Tax=Burkholderia sp. BCC0405 TaxID=2676298 RepID=UPI0015885C6C|nr:DUF5672 family protein [Burkholderia sp. BCC0405]
MNSSSTLDLRNVTLCAADSIHPALAARALEISAAQCHFADAILFTHEVVPTFARIVPIPRLQSKGDDSAFMVKHLVNHVTTPWVLVVQWDGYVLDAATWSDAFLGYDYIGASWPFHRDSMNVGNGGFSLRSVKLLHALADTRLQLLPGAYEDDLICRLYRPLLETEYGIRFAPADVANRFAYERGCPDSPTFGFHGAFNLWRHVEDDTMMDIISALDIRTLTSIEIMQLLIAYCELRKFGCVKVMYQRYRRIWSAQQFAQNMVASGVPREAVLQCVEICENVVKSNDRAGFCG